MKRNSLIKYFFVVALNLFLFIPVFFTFFVLSPIHILIYWLSFDTLLSKNSFLSNWTAIRFSGLAFVFQWLFIFVALYISGEKDLFLSNLLTEPVFSFILIMTVVEFVIHFYRYSKYLKNNTSS
jgi:hypothetical protein